METNKNYTMVEWETLKSKIRSEMGWCDIKEYSHNIIMLYLNQLTDEKTEQIATELQLGLLGWTHLDKGGKIPDDDMHKNSIVYRVRDARIKAMRK